VTAGVRTDTWKRTTKHTKPSTIQSVSFMCVMGHIRTRSRARGGMWRHSSIPTTGWRTTSSGLLHFCGGVPIRQRRPLNLLHPYRCKHWQERVTCPQLWSCYYVTRRRPIPHFKRIVTHNRYACGPHSTTDYVGFLFMVLCAPHATAIMYYCTAFWRSSFFKNPSFNQKLQYTPT